jgi:hypothetical protein
MSDLLLALIKQLILESNVLPKSINFRLVLYSLLLKFFSKSLILSLHLRLLYP